jgi:hypothetical protein
MDRQTELVESHAKEVAASEVERRYPVATHLKSIAPPLARAVLGRIGVCRPSQHPGTEVYPLAITFVLEFR